MMYYSIGQEIEYRMIDGGAWLPGIVYKSREVRNGTAVLYSISSVPDGYTFVRLAQDIRVPARKPEDFRLCICKHDEGSHGDMTGTCAFGSVCGCTQFRRPVTVPLSVSDIQEEISSLTRRAENVADLATSLSQNYGTAMAALANIRDMLSGILSSPALTSDPKTEEKARNLIQYVDDVRSRLIP